MDTETELRNIRTRISQTQSRQARAQIELDNATAKLAAAKATLLSLIHI